MAEGPQYRFVSARATLRRLLAAYLDSEPRAIKLAYGSSGKPRLCGSDASAGLHFSLSHSGQHALYAFSGSLVGVDLERLRSVRDEAKLAARFFAPEEARWLQCLAVSERRAAFLSLWTLREAYVKALGTGLASFKSFEVICPPGPEPALRFENRAVQESYTLRSIKPERRLVAALAVQRDLNSLRLWKLA